MRHDKSRETGGLSAIHSWAIIGPLALLIVIFTPEGSSVYSLWMFDQEYNCLMRSTTGLSCGSCGLTGAFQAIIQVDLIKATLRHPLSIPTFLIVVFFSIAAILDIVGIKFPLKWWLKFYHDNWKAVVYWPITIFFGFYLLRIIVEIKAGYLISGGFKDFMKIIFHFPFF